MKTKCKGDCGEMVPDTTLAVNIPLFYARSVAGMLLFRMRITLSLSHHPSNTPVILSLHFRAKDPFHCP
jgi:hypothetical protein